MCKGGQHLQLWPHTLYWKRQCWAFSCKTYLISRQSINSRPQWFYGLSSGIRVWLWNRAQVRWRKHSYTCVARCFYCQRANLPLQWRNRRSWKLSSKLYHDTFAWFLPKAYVQVVGTIIMSTQLCCRTELLLSTLSIENVCRMSKTVWNAKMEIFEPSLKQRLVTVSKK